jgi:hypothetical protein
MSKESLEGFMRILASTTNAREKVLLRRYMAAQAKTKKLGPIIIVDEEGNECQTKLL